MQGQHTRIPSRQLDRRSVMKAAAWSVPAVSLAAATPAYAVSGTLTDLTLQWQPASGTAPRLASLGQRGNPTVAAGLDERQHPTGFLNFFTLTSPKQLSNLIATITVDTPTLTQVFRSFRGFGAHALRVGSASGTLLPNTGYNEVRHPLGGNTHLARPHGMTFTATSTFALPTLPAGGRLDLFPQWVLTQLDTAFTETAVIDASPPVWNVTVTITQVGKTGSMVATARGTARRPIID